MQKRLQQIINNRPLTTFTTPFFQQAEIQSINKLYTLCVCILASTKLQAFIQIHSSLNVEPKETDRKQFFARLESARSF